MGLAGRPRARQAVEAPTMFTSAVTKTLAARIVILLWVSFGGQPAFAHGFAGSGWMHPITGIDHMLAMLAVGAWSAQMAGRAIITVPAAFVCAMAAGSLAAQCHFAFPATEAVIALSLFALGIAIALDRRPAMPIAALATALFGLAHGWAHGAEIPHTADTPTYVAGFLTTTAGLHVAGAAGGLLLLERHNGRRWLRSAGIVIAIAGSGLAGIRLQSTWIR